MKNLITLITLSFGLSASALECTQWEARFMGHVKETKVAKNAAGKMVCTFKIEITSQYLPSAVCPVSAGEISVADFEDADCSKEVGTDLSGVVVMQEGKFWIE